jgi:hypothetical protein
MGDHMEQQEHIKNPQNINVTIRWTIGLVMIVIGGTVLIEQYLQTGWLIFLLCPAGGLYCLWKAVRKSSDGFFTAAYLLLGIGLGIFFMFSEMIQWVTLVRVGWLSLCFGFSWLLIFLTPGLYKRNFHWWSLIPASIFLGLAVCFLVIRISIFAFFFYPIVFLGVAFLAWGSFSKKIGLIIPGALLVSIGTGIFSAWENVTKPNGLTQTGIMLVWFALGWMLIIVFSRVITEKFVWWPLIPGGIFAVVGWSLYLGGNPTNAVNFIGNSSSVGLIIFGLYLLLLRRGIHR